MKKFFFLTILVVALVLGAPAVIGIKAESRYQLAIDHIQQSGLRVVSHSYSRGWFGAKAETGIVFVAPEGASAATGPDSPHLTLVSTIAHGPLVSTGLGIAEIDSQIEFAEKTLALPDDQAQIHTMIDLDGSGHTRINLPAADMTGSAKMPDISFDGLSGEMQFGIDGDIDTHLVLHGLVVGSDGQKLLELGETRLQSNSRTSVSGLMLGNGKFSMQRLKLSGPEQGEQVAMQQLDVDLASSEELEQVSAVASYRVERVEVGHDVYGPGQLRVELNRLSGPVLVRLQRAITDIKSQSMSDAQRGMALMGVVMNVASELLKGDPGIVIKPLSLVTPDGTVEGELSLRGNGLRLADISNMPVLAGKLVADLSLRAPEKLFRSMLVQQSARRLKQQIAAMIEQGGEAPRLEQGELQQLIERQVDQQLSEWISQEVIVRDGSDLATVASLSSGLLTVNGKTIPLPQ